MRNQPQQSGSGALIFMILALVAGAGFVVYTVTEKNAVQRDSALRSEMQETERHRAENASYEAKRLERQVEDKQNREESKKTDEMLREAKERAEKYNTGAPK